MKLSRADWEFILGITVIVFLYTLAHSFTK